jgi:hypothetical protein
MPYGLNANDIISSFSGATSGVFSSGVMNGIDVINQEIEFAYEKLTSYFPELTLRRMERMEFEVPVVSGGDSFELAFFPLQESLKVWKVSNCFKPCGPWVFLNDCWSCGGYSSDMDYNILPIQELQEGVDYSGSGKEYTLTAPLVDAKIVASYDIDKELTVYPSIKAMLRDLVCYNLGNRIFANIEGGKWSIVEHYEKEWERWEGKISDKNFKLKEFAKVKRLFSNDNIKSISFLRG